MMENGDGDGDERFYSFICYLQSRLELLSFIKKRSSMIRRDGIWETETKTKLNGEKKKNNFVILANKLMVRRMSI